MYLSNALYVHHKRGSHIYTLYVVHNKTMYTPLSTITKQLWYIAFSVTHDVPLRLSIASNQYLITCWQFDVHKRYWTAPVKRMLTDYIRIIKQTTGGYIVCPTQHSR